MMTGQQRKQLHQALLSAFPTTSALAQMVQFELDQELSNITRGTSLSRMAYDLIEWAEANDNTIELLNGALNGNPSNMSLRAVTEQLTFQEPSYSPIPAPSIPTPAINNTPIDSVALRQILVSRFNLDELRTLCSDIGVDYDNIGGVGREAKARELISSLQRRGRLLDLVRLIGEARPGAFREDLATLAPTRPNISVPRAAPLPSPRFVNRHTEIRTAESSLIKGTVVVILQGIGGVGKTALAAQIAARTADAFLGGTLWATLGPNPDLSALFADWTQISPVEVSFSRDLRAQGQAANVRLALERWQEEYGRVLIILDDLLDQRSTNLLLQALPFNCAILITTRNANLDRDFEESRDVQIIEVNPLSEEAALQMIRQGIRSSDDELTTARELVLLCAGLPLALEWSIGQAKEIGLSRIVEWLRRDPMLSTLGISTSSSLIINLDPNFVVTYENLSEELKRRFRLLGVFDSEQFDVNAVASVWKVLPVGALDELLELKQRNLLDYLPDTGKYSQSSALHAYALVLLEQSGEITEARLCHARYYLTLLHHGDWKAIVANDREIRQGWDTVISLSDPMVFDYLSSFDRYLAKRGSWYELLNWAQAAQRVVESNAAENSPQPGEVSKILLCLKNIGNALFHLGRLDEALSIFIQGLDLAIRSSDKLSEAIACISIGRIHRTRNQYIEALDYLERGLKLFEGLGENENVATALIDIGLLVRLRGDYDKALKYFRRSLDVAKKAEDKMGEAAALHHLGSLHRARGQLDVALLHYQQSLLIRRAEGDRAGEAATLNSIGDIYRDRGDMIQAREHIDNSLRITQQLSNQAEEASILQNLGRLLRASGDWDAALSRLAECEKICRTLGDNATLSLILSDEGLTLLEMGETQAAQEKFEAARLLAHDIGNIEDEAVALANLGSVAVSLADWEQAQELYKKALNIRERLSDTLGQVAILANLGRIQVNLKDWPDALSYYQRAQKTAADTDDRRGQAAALSNIGAILVETGNLEGATSAYQQALRLQRELGDNAAVDITQQTLSNLQRRQDQAQTSLSLLMAEAQRFFRAAGFRLSTTGEAISFLSIPATPIWQKKLGLAVYTRVVASKPIDANAVLTIRTAAQQVVAESKQAFVLVDHPVEDSAWLQIATIRSENFNVIPIPITLLSDFLTTDQSIPESLVLTKYLERFIGRGVDPYDVKHPVSNVLDFFGREALANSLAERLIDGQPIGLFGLRKMGKSSLMQYMQHIMPCPTARLDLQAGVKLTSLYERLLRTWNKHAQESRFRDMTASAGFQTGLDLVNINLDPRDPTTQFVKLIQETLDKLTAQTPGAQLAIFLDEIEHIIPPLNATGSALEQYLSLMRTLRGLVQEDGRITLLVAGVDPTINRASRWGNDEQQNPFFQFLLEEYLPPLLELDCIQMIRNVGQQAELRYNDEGVTYVAQASGGHPYLARLLCSLTYQRKKRQPGEVQTISLQQASEDFVFDQRYATLLGEKGMWQEATSIKLWGEEAARANQNILTDLAESKVSLKPAHLTSGTNSIARRSALFALEQLHVIRSVNESINPDDQRYELTFGLFRSWIRRVRLGLDE